MIAYLATNRVSGKQYVGISKEKTPDGRWKQHLNRTTRKRGGGAYPLHRAILKYGRDAFLVEHIASAKNWKDLCALEVSLIAQYGSHITEGGYNLTRGGEGTLGLIRSEEHKNKTRKALLGQKHSIERCKANGQAKAGRRLSDAHRAKIATASTGRFHTTDARAKISTARTGMKFSAETCAKISASKIGIPKPPRTPEHAAKLGAACKRFWQKKRQSLAAAAVVVSVMAFSPMQVSAETTTKTVSWFLAHPEVRAKINAMCRDNPGEAQHAPNCINAYEAGEKASIDRMLKGIDAANANKSSANDCYRVSRLFPDASRCGAQ